MLLSCSVDTEEIIIDKLKCEYLINPVGIDSEKPRFTWQMRSDRPGAAQKAYNIFVGTDSAGLAGGNGNIWETGKLVSATLPVIYQGPRLDPFTRYFWAVKVQDEKGKWSGLSPVAFFETGMMDTKNWQGRWINDIPGISIKQAPYFRKNFKIQKNVKSARAYIAVAGLYELFINGRRIGNHILDPMVTRFDRRTLYVTYDVTGNLQNDENVIGVLLGNGWYNLQSLAVWNFDKAPWRARPKFCLDLRITYDDGSQEAIVTGQDWKTSLSPVIFNSIYTGEHYDARLEQDGWNNTGFDDSEWPRAKNTSAPSSNIVAQSLHPVRHVEEIPVSEMIQTGTNKYLFIFGRNFSGVTRLKVSGEAGTTIRLKHSEKLDKDGNVDQRNLTGHFLKYQIDDSDPFQTDVYILKGQGEETFMPRFNYKGFQYVELISDKPVKLTKESLTAYFMHSDVPAVGQINSSNPTLNKIWKAANSSYLSNLFGYPTDCPQREKLGWTGDAHLNIETGLYNFDAITIYEKWLADHQDEQQPNGLLPCIIPSSGWGYHIGNGPDWVSTIAIMPWNIYLFYGDSKLLESCYDNIKRYLDYMDKFAPTGLTTWGLGDWIPVKSKTPFDFTSSTYLYIDATILSKAAKLFDKQADYEKYSAQADKIKNAINTKFLNTETGIYGAGVQTELSVPLKWAYVPQGLETKVAQNLADRVIADDSHVDVGLIGSKAILNALSENGFADLAYKVASQETFPSWGWWIVNGATTLDEHWDVGTASMNHIGFGEINAWFYNALGGIFPDEARPGFKNVILKPNFVIGLEYFDASYEGQYGTIVSSWKRSGGDILYKVTIPANSTASLYLKNPFEILESEKELSENKHIHLKKDAGSHLEINLESGSYEFLISNISNEKTKSNSQ